MMTAKRLWPVLTVLTACLLFVPSSWAAPRRYAGGFREGFELNTYLTFSDFDSKSEIDDDIGIGFRFGYLYTPNHEFEFLFNDVSTTDQFFTGETVDVTQLQAAYVYNFTSHGVVPYLTAGIGFVHTDDSDLGTETDPVLGLGAGVRFFLGRVVYARFELRRDQFNGDGTVFAKDESFGLNEFAFGIGWRFPTR
jgi:outer membrane protein with beta-barrel domain